MTLLVLAALAALGAPPASDALPYGTKSLRDAPANADAEDAALPPADANPSTEASATGEDGDDTVDAQRAPAPDERDTSGGSTIAGALVRSVVVAGAATALMVPTTAAALSTQALIPGGGLQGTGTFGLIAALAAVGIGASGLVFSLAYGALYDLGLDLADAPHDIWWLSGLVTGVGYVAATGIGALIIGLVALDILQGGRRAQQPHLGHYAVLGLAAALPACGVAITPAAWARVVGTPDVDDGRFFDTTTDDGETE